MEFIKGNREVKTVRQGDPDFMIYEGTICYPRAMLHITPDCPSNIRTQLEWAMTEGYIKTVAYVPGKQLTWEKLTND
jgi:hypothetical protein